MLAGISALLTVDQKQSQWGAAQYMADSVVGLGLFTAPRVDPFHRSWRDFQFAMNHSHGNFRHSSVQLNMALNVNYQPFGTGAHLSKRQDVKKEWARLLPAYDEQFESLVWEQMKTVYDPEIPINVVDLGLIYDCRISKLPDRKRYVYVEMTLTAPGCGMGDILVQ